MRIEARAPDTVEMDGKGEEYSHFVPVNYWKKAHNDVPLRKPADSIQEMQEPQENTPLAEPSSHPKNILGLEVLKGG